MQPIQNTVANPWQARHALAAALISLGVFGSCEDGPSARRAAGAAAESARTPASASANGPATPPVRASASSASSDAPPPPRCPAEMNEVGGATFWVGGNFNGEEKPNFETKVADFCMGRTEVTVASYQKCVTEGACEPAHTKRNWCNAKLRGRDDHPINCVDYRQATAYCKHQGARLPTEVEWEYAARGGAKYLSYSWGNEHPDGRTCWKHPGGSCKVASYAAGAFGLYDMTGNVWEWTQDWYGPYPWPRVDGHARVYRGGSWSRRFVKWMRPQLRNRAAERDWGSHLGFRCAITPKDVTCPYGKYDSGEEQGQCRAGVERARCKAGLEFNGLRCTRPGAPPCNPGWEILTGHGCVRSDGESSDPTEKAVLTDGITRTRSPEFDADCQQYQRGRPQAYRYSGGNHAGRNQVSRAAGCKNRDVGAGWNSTCCP